MRNFMTFASRSLAITLVALAMAAPAAAQKAPAWQSRFAEVNGVRLHYLVAGKGEPVILLHGYAQNSRMWAPLIPEPAKTRLVIAPDLRGFGQSAKPEGGYDKSLHFFTSIILGATS